MRRLLLALLLLALAAPQATARETAVGVGLREFQLSLYRQKVRAGTVKFNLTNFGEDPHDLVVRTRSGRVVKASPEVPAGGNLSFRVRLRKAGRYVVFCSIADHEQRGMKARLRVTH